MKQSNFLALNWNDVLKGLLMAVLTPTLVTVEQTVENGSLTFNWHLIGISAIGGGLAYIIKNFLSPPAATSDSPIAK